ncbi:hypothetical protein NUH88_04135 [Nisaea acidiphila]|uniref:DNA-binding protein n=1 Tax=Nisaea acidiphila TaxID=1862145 RepID=A0A9J7AT75_9PROT|nr:hypothetical protein [Nisaea acidiphila]UUX50891.1 hypothetical protein NUH88_04135 [Nisaea acidiphila]
METKSGPPVFDGYISEAEYAAQRGVSIRTCQRDRAMRKAPPHVLIGKAIYYRVEAVRDWLLRRETDFDQHHSSRSRGRAR